MNEFLLACSNRLRATLNQVRSHRPFFHDVHKWYNKIAGRENVCVCVCVHLSYRVYTCKDVCIREPNAMHETPIYTKAILNILLLESHTLCTRDEQAMGCARFYLNFVCVCFLCYCQCHCTRTHEPGTNRTRETV